MVDDGFKPTTLVPFGIELLVMTTSPATAQCRRTTPTNAAPRAPPCLSSRVGKERRPLAHRFLHTLRPTIVPLSPTIVPPLCPSSPATSTAPHRHPSWGKVLPSLPLCLAPVFCPSRCPMTSATTHPLLAQLTTPQASLTLILLPQPEVTAEHFTATRLLR
jgi:hypothetical protein